MSLWIIIALAVVGLALVILAIVLLVRQKRKSPPKAAAPPPLTAVWSRFQASLSASARGDPVIVVLGERLAGKTRLVQAAMDLAGQPATAPGAPDDPRLTLHAGRQVRVQEISGELLEDTRPDARDALRGLWAQTALEIPLVVAVIDASAPSFSPGGLPRLGSLIRDKIDLLTALRGTAPRVRVAVTHLDAAAEGFVDLASVARAAGRTSALTPAGRSGPELSASVAELEPYLSPAVGQLSAPALGRAARFLADTGPSALRALEPFLSALSAARAEAPAPALEGIVLSGLPEGGAGALLGDPLTVEAAVAERDARALDRRRTVRSAVVAGLAAALLVGLYAWHYRAVVQAGSAVEKFLVVEAGRREAQESWAGDSAARGAEAAAAESLDDALAPIWPPLRAAYPARKQNLAPAFLKKVRDLYILPVARGSDRVKRIYALSLLYASNDDKLGQQIKAAPEAWASALDVPTRVVTDTLAWSERPWTGSVGTPQASSAEVGADEWQRWLDLLDSALRRDRITPEELSDLQTRGRELDESVGGALEVRGLDAVIEELRAVRGAEIDLLIGRGAVGQRGPQWVSESWESLEPVLRMVRQASMNVRDARGKSLRAALEDIAYEGRAEPQTEQAYTIALPGRAAHVIQVDAWSKLMRASRASRYVRAFIDDQRVTGRSPFFARGADYPSVGRISGRGVRGATRSIPGLYTARAVAADVKPALLAFDATLDATALPADDRAALTRLVQVEMERYAGSYRAALWDYVSSFRLDVTSIAGLRSDIEDMVGPASWLTEFWVDVADNARIEAEGNIYLEPLSQALSTLAPIVALMTGEKGKYPLLDKYYAVVTPLVAALDAGTPAPPGPSGAPLEDRLPPLGKMGLALLDTDKPAPLPDTHRWLDGARLLDRALRGPFLSPVEMAYEYALQNVEKTLDQAYRVDVRPLAAPHLARFPFDPRADTDASPDPLLATFGPKGTFRAAIDGLLTPVCKKGQTSACLPKSPTSYRAVKVPGEAMDLATWSANLAGVLWDDAGKPKSIALQARPRALPEVKRGDAVVATLSFLRSGTTTVYAFNQAPAWQALPLAWSTSSAAIVGVERSDPAGGEKLVLTTEGEGSLWRFYRLLCKAQRVAEGSATWVLDAPVTFDIQPDPWSLVVPPGNRGRRCFAIVAGK